ncbi:uncharacterized protein LOC134538168 isoform X2 [Bacillus rossius redtenbacheri]|uniref:uncharacterized protein LOC134538168 isoform X2 n=1 Tax=Bacillus rossius redtenbacheri TaxID=93214 RepID=UPI002FDDF3E6
MVKWMLVRVTELDPNVSNGRPIKKEAIDLFRYRTTYTVGRAMNCNLRMLSSLVSRLHGELRLLENIVFIKDLRSSNGTYVNKHRILPERELSLCEGDMIGFGSENVIGPESFVFTLVSRQVLCIDLSVDDDNDQEPDSSQPAVQVPPVVLHRESPCSPELVGSSSDVPATRKRHLPDVCQLPCKMHPGSECARRRISSTSCFQAEAVPQNLLSGSELLKQFSRSQTPLLPPGMFATHQTCSSPAPQVVTSPAPQVVTSGSSDTSTDISRPFSQSAEVIHSSYSEMVSKPVGALDHCGPVLATHCSQSLPVSEPPSVPVMKPCVPECSQPAMDARPLQSVIDPKLAGDVEHPLPNFMSFHSSPCEPANGIVQPETETEASRSHSFTNTKPADEVSSVPVPSSLMCSIQPVLIPNEIECSPPAVDMHPLHSSVDPKSAISMESPQPCASENGMEHSNPAVRAHNSSVIDPKPSSFMECHQSSDGIEYSHPPVLPSIPQAALVAKPEVVTECSRLETNICPSRSVTCIEPGNDVASHLALMSSHSPVSEQESVIEGSGVMQDTCPSKSVTDPKHAYGAESPQPIEMLCQSVSSEPAERIEISQSKSAVDPSQYEMTPKSVDDVESLLAQMMGSSQSPVFKKGSMIEGSITLTNSQSLMVPKPVDGVQSLVPNVLSCQSARSDPAVGLELSKCETNVSSSCSVRDPKPIDNVESLIALMMDSQSPVSKPVSIMEVSGPITDTSPSHSVTDVNAANEVEAPHPAASVTLSSVKVATDNSSTVTSPDEAATPTCPPCVVVLTKSSAVDLQLSSSSVRRGRKSCPRKLKVPTPPALSVVCPPSVNISPQAVPVDSAQAGDIVPTVTPLPEILSTLPSFSPPVAESAPDIQEYASVGGAATVHSLATTLPLSSSASRLSTTSDIFPNEDDDVDEKPVLVKLELSKKVFAEDEIITISDDEAYPNSQLFEESEKNDLEQEIVVLSEDESDSYDHYLFMNINGSGGSLYNNATHSGDRDEETSKGERIETEMECAFEDEVRNDIASTSGTEDRKVSLEKSQKEKGKKHKQKTSKSESSSVKTVKSNSKENQQENLKSLCNKVRETHHEKRNKAPCKEPKRAQNRSKTHMKVVPVNVKVTNRNRSALLTEALCASIDTPKGKSRASKATKVNEAKQDVKKIIEFKNMLHCPTPIQPEIQNTRLDERENHCLRSKRIPKLSFKDLDQASASTSTTRPTIVVQSPLASPVLNLPSMSAVARVPETVRPVGQEKRRKSVRFREGSQLEQVQIIPPLLREPRGLVTSHSSYRSTNMNDIIKEICSWKTAWFRDQANFLPPSVDPKSVLPMLEFFTSHEDYKSIVERLMFCELWELVSDECKEKQSFCFIIINDVTDVVEPGIHLMDIYCYMLLSAQRPHVAMQLRQGHLVALELILEKSGDPFSYSQSLSQSGSGRRFCEVIGYVVQAQFQPVSARGPPDSPLCKIVPNADQILNLVVRTDYRDFDLRLKDAMRLRPLCYIRPMLRAFRAVRELKHSSLCNLILNPRKEHFRRPPITEKLYLPGSLNDNQQEAVLEVAQVCRNSNGHNICLIHGPPGTGKSHVIVNLVVQLLYGSARKMEQKTRILLCAQSNAAVDELVRRLLVVRRSLDERNKMKLVRFGQLETMHPEVQQYSVQNIARHNLDMARQGSTNTAQRSLDENIRMLSMDLATLQRISRPSPENKHRMAYISNRINSLKSSQNEPAYRREVQQAERAERLRVFSGAEIVCTTIGSCCNSEMEDFFRREESTMKYSCCIIDEATKCWEPETLVPLMLNVNNLVLVGDPAQLQGIVRSSLAKKRGFEKSLFGRISSCVSMLQPNPVKFLSVQYRMHPAISHWPNKYLYSGRLRDAPCTQRSCPLKPYIVLALGYMQGVVRCDPRVAAWRYRGCADVPRLEAGDGAAPDVEERQAMTTHRENLEEAEFVVQLALTVRDEVDPSFSVGIITPYNQQKHIIARLLQQRGRLRDLSVDVIDSVQGQERDVVLVSLVRTDGVGFLGSESRLNVALTRARYSLIVCGNFTSLQGVKVWDDLLCDAQDRRLFLKVSEKHANSRVYLKSLIMRDSL